MASSPLPPHYLTSVSIEQLGRDLVEEVQLFDLFSESEMVEVERYVQRLVEERRNNRLRYVPVQLERVTLSLAKYL